MPFHFSKKTCANCHHGYDPVEMSCPNCGQENDEKRFAIGHLHQIHTHPGRQIAFFLIGLVGLSVASLTISTIVSFALGIIYAGDPVGLDTALESTWAALLMNSLAYVATSIALFFVSRPCWKQIARGFKSWIPYVAALVAVILMFGIELFYNNLVADPIMRGLGITPSANANQQSIAAMVSAYPFICVIVFGILGPAVEEMTYRVGLFSFLGRVNKPVAYLLGMLIFGAIHFSWTSFTDPTKLAVELINLPPYIGAGALLCFVYDRFGLSASFMAHSTYNILGVILMVIPS